MLGIKTGKKNLNGLPGIIKRSGHNLDNPGGENNAGVTLNLKQQLFISYNFINQCSQYKIPNHSILWFQ